MAKKVAKKSNKRNVSEKTLNADRHHIQSSFNNTIVTLTDTEGNALS